MSSSSDALGPSQLPLQPGPPLALPASAPSQQRPATGGDFSPTRDVADNTEVAAFGTLHQPQCITVCSPEALSIVTSFASVGMIPPESDSASGTAATTDVNYPASHMTVPPTVPASVSGASPATDDGLVVTQPTSAESAAMPSSASTPPFTRTRTWLENQRRPCPIPYPSSVAVNSSYLLRLAHGNGRTVASSGNTAGWPKQKLLPLAQLSSSTNAVASAAHAFAHSCPTTLPASTATAVSGATMVHLPSSTTMTSESSQRRSNVAAARISVDAPRALTLPATETADDDPGAPVTLAIPPADGLHITTAPAASSLSSYHTSTGGPSAANVPYRTRSGGAGTGVGECEGLHEDLKADVASHCELMPPTAHAPLTSIAAAVAACDTGSVDGAEVNDTTTATRPVSAAAGSPAVHSMNGSRASTLVGSTPAMAHIVSAPRDCMHCLPSPPLVASGEPQTLQRQPFDDCGDGSNSGERSKTCRGPLGSNWLRGGSSSLRCSRSHIGEGHTIRLVGGLPGSRKPQKLPQSVPTEATDGQIPPPVLEQQLWLALQCRLMSLRGGGTITGGAAVEAQRGPSRGDGDAGVEAALAAGAAAPAYDVHTSAFALSGAQRVHSGKGGDHQISAATLRSVSETCGGLSSSSVAQRETSHGRAHSPAAPTDALSASPGGCTSARVALSSPPRAAANKGVSEVSKSWDESGGADAALIPWTPPKSGEALPNSYQAFRMHRYHTWTGTQPTQHGAMREVSWQHQRPRPPLLWGKNASEAASQKGDEDEGPQARQRPVRRNQEQAHPGAPEHQGDGATVASSLRRFYYMVPVPSPPDQQRQKKVGLSNRDSALPLQHPQSRFLPSSSAMAAAAFTPSSPPAAAAPPLPTPLVVPTFALFGALERLSRFSEMVQLCHDHADVLDDFLARLTLQLHRNSYAVASLASGANAARVQSSLPSLATSAAHDDCGFLRWHRIIMFLLRQPSELVKVGAEFFTDAVNSWPLHMLYLTCCFYVTAREHGFNALKLALCKGGIFCSGKGLFAALAVSMAQNEEDLIQSTACMYRAAFYTGVLMRKHHQHFETETRLTANGGFTLLVVNIPVITLRRLVARVNEGYDVFAPMRDIHKEKEMERGSTWLNPNNNTAVSAGTTPTPRGRCGGRLHSPNSSTGHVPASSSFAKFMPSYPHSVIEVSRVISSRSAVLCGHPLDMLRLDTILARFADFNDVKIHKEYLPSGGPENSYFFNKHMAHELMELWKARGVSFSLASVQLPVYSPVNGDLWAASLRTPFDPPAPADMPTATMASASLSNAVFCSAASPRSAGYRDEWWMFNVAEAATCSNQDLTRSLCHMQDGSVLLDFSTHAMRIGRLIAWTNKSITVLVEPGSRHEPLAMPPPRRSPRDEAVRNTMKKLAIINKVLREVGDSTQQPPDALANPSVELSTTFTELGLLEVLPGPQERAGTRRFGAPPHAASGALSERQSGYHGHGSSRYGNAPPGVGGGAETPSTCRLDAANSPGEPRSLASLNGTAAGRRMKLSIGALVPLQSAPDNSANAGTVATTRNLNNPNASGYKYASSLSCSSAVAVVGGLEGELWHTISPVGQSDTSSDPHTPPVAPMSTRVFASLQPKTAEASVAGAASSFAPPASFLSLPQEAYVQPLSISTSGGRSSAVMVTDSLHDAPVSAFASPSDAVARLASELEYPTAQRVRSVPRGQRSSHKQMSGTTAWRRAWGIQCEAPAEGDYPNSARDAAVDLDGGSGDARRISADTFTHAAQCILADLHEDDLVIRRNNDYDGIVNVYQVSALITYYEMQFNSVLCDGAVFFARLLKRASGIAFPSYTLLLCPTVFSLLELWDGYEFEELWRRSLNVPVCSRATSPIPAGLM
ncbi:hypothetical protein, conserved [Leishmania tarentolae]|uniref:Uncharacterized protein n=1 Tax=Leishmania tarentolae TaxID=5689 RepID=A0A640KAI8_LEITA|nr:hypothetical protein, conserved [Leishmania tarentolae]